MKPRSKDASAFDREIDKRGDAPNYFAQCGITCTPAKTGSRFCSKECFYAHGHEARHESLCAYCAKLVPLKKVRALYCSASCSTRQYLIPKRPRSADALHAARVRLLRGGCVFGSPLREAQNSIFGCKDNGLLKRWLAGQLFGEVAVARDKHIALVLVVGPTECANYFNAAGYDAS